LTDRPQTPPTASIIAQYCECFGKDERRVFLVVDKGESSIRAKIPLVGVTFWIAIDRVCQAQTNIRTSQPPYCIKRTKSHSRQRSLARKTNSD
jgi:hypothetical protein